jgi:ribonuclease R
VTRAGLFVKLDGTGADGFVPIGSLGREYYHHDPDQQTLTGERSGRVLALGMAARVRLVEAEPVTGGLRLELLDASGFAPRPAKRGGKRPPRKKLERSRLAKAKAKRKARRG